jgi:hypothetical protein
VLAIHATKIRDRKKLMARLLGRLTLSLGDDALRNLVRIRLGSGSVWKAESRHVGIGLLERAEVPTKTDICVDAALVDALRGVSRVGVVLFGR